MTDFITTETTKDGKETLVIDIGNLSPRASIEFIKALKEDFDVKFNGGEHGI